MLFAAGASKRKKIEVDAEQLSPHGHHDHGADHIDTFSFSSNSPLDIEQFKLFLVQLPKEIIRAKGLPIRSGGAAPLLFNYVCGRFDFRDLPDLKNPVATQAVFIGEINEALKEKIIGRLRVLELRAEH